MDNQSIRLVIAGEPARDTIVDNFITIAFLVVGSKVHIWHLFVMAFRHKTAFKYATFLKGGKRKNK